MLNLYAQSVPLNIEHEISEENAKLADLATWLNLHEQFKVTGGR